MKARRLLWAAFAAPPLASASLFADHIWLCQSNSFSSKSSLPTRKPLEPGLCLVVGGRTVAIASAYFLRLRGFEAPLLSHDPRPDAGLGTSDVNAGTIRLSRSSSLISWGMLTQCVTGIISPPEMGSTFRISSEAMWSFRAVLNALNGQLVKDVGDFIHHSSPCCLAVLEQTASAEVI